MNQIGLGEAVENNELDRAKCGQTKPPADQLNNIIIDETCIRQLLSGEFDDDFDKVDCLYETIEKNPELDALLLEVSKKLALEDIQKNGVPDFE